MKVAVLIQPITAEADFRYNRAREDMRAKLNNMGYVVAGSVMPTQVRRAPLRCLSRVLSNAQQCDVVYFATGWEDDKFCRTINHVCAKYKVPSIYECEGKLI